MEESSREQLEEYEYVRIFARVKTEIDTNISESNVESNSPKYGTPPKCTTPRSIPKSSSCFNFSILDNLASEKIKGNKRTLNHSTTPAIRCSVSSSINTPTEKAFKRQPSPRNPNLFIIIKEATNQVKPALVTPLKQRMERMDCTGILNNGESGVIRCVSIQNHKTLQLQRTVDQSPRGNPIIYNFDKVFRESSSQEDVYNEAVQNNVSTLFQGINSTVIANGAPGSGKTFTLQGTKAKPGVISRSLQDIFAYISKARADCDRKDFKVEISVVELQPSNQFRSILKEPNSTDSRSRTPSCHPDSGMETDFPSWAAAAKRVSASSGEEAMAIVDDATKALKKRAGKGDDVPSRSDQDTMLSPSLIFSC